MSFIPEYWMLIRCIVSGKIRDKVRKVGSIQIWIRGRLDYFFDSVEFIPNSLNLNSMYQANLYDPIFKQGSSTLCVSKKKLNLI